MPFNGSGTFTIVNTFIPNTTILSSAVNTNFSDIATGLSDCLTRDGQVGMTAALKAIAGTAAAPSITFSSDTGTGMYLISAGNLGLTSNGALALQLNSFQVAQFQQAAAAKVLCVLDTALASTSSNINTIATAGTGSIAIGTSTNWPTNGYLLAGNEVMSYTVASANGLTINTRGDMGTTSVSHSTGATITFLDSALDKTTLLLPSRATASRPTAPAPGDYAFNTGLGAPEYFNGTVWVGPPPVNPPQGYLSPTAGTPIITSDAVSQTSIFYNPYKGNALPIPIAGVFTMQTFATAAIALSASQTTAGIYDIYGFISTTNSTLTFGISPSWAAGSSGSITPGSCARGTGAGGTAITRINGLWTNTVDMTMLNGASSYTVATASGILLGSIYIGATAGTVNLHRAYGQNRQWGIWNAFNRVPVYSKCGDSSSPWTVTTAGVRPPNNSTANSVALFTGLAEEVFDLDYIDSCTASGSVGSIIPGFAIGINSIATAAGTKVPLVTSVTVVQAAYIKYTSTPLLGVNIANALENGSTGMTINFNGTEAAELFTARWRA